LPLVVSAPLRFRRAVALPVETRLDPLVELRCAARRMYSLNAARSRHLLTMTISLASRSLCQT